MPVVYRLGTQVDFDGSKLKDQRCSIDGTFGPPAKHGATRSKLLGSHKMTGRGRGNNAFAALALCRQLSAGSWRAETNMIVAGKATQLAASSYAAPVRRRPTASAVLSDISIFARGWHATESWSEATDAAPRPPQRAVATPFPRLSAHGAAETNPAHWPKWPPFVGEAAFKLAPACARPTPQTIRPRS